MKKPAIASEAGIMYNLCGETGRGRDVLTAGPAPWLSWCL